MTKLNSNDDTLSLHMARLAKADQIRASIGFFVGAKHSKRDDVMHRQRFPYVASTIEAVSVLLFNDLFPDFIPAFTSVCRNTTNIAGRIICHKCTGFFKANATAKSCRSILSLKPWLLVKNSVAVLANLLASAFPSGVFVSGRTQLKSIRWPESNAKFVPSHIGLGANVQSLASSVTSRALKRTKPRSLNAIRLDLIGLIALFANDLDSHVTAIAHHQYLATGVAAIKAGKTFIGIEHNPKHFETAIRRITAAYEDSRK